MKKIYLTIVAGLSAGLMLAQTGRKATFTKVVSPDATNNTNQPIVRRCATPAPPKEWEEQFQKLIAQYIKDHPEVANGKTNVAYTIPIVFHVIHGGQTVGTFPNIAQAQINSQVTVLNADYGGTGLNSGSYPATAFVNWATAQGLPAANKDAGGRVKIANTQVTFCLAQKDPTGATLSEPGIDRVNYVTKGWSNPTSFTSISTFQSFIDGTVKPGTIWDPTRYFNVWLTDCNGSVGLLGYATFPAGTGLTGLSGFGTATTDGVWVYTKSCGSSSIYSGGSYAPPYDKGRTLTHEAGHWLGLRHIWGDAACASDYCNDTPPAAAANYNTSSPGYPFHSGTCTGNSPDGEMYMNFMDYVGDNLMYMFSVDQMTRIQTACANGTYRSQLTASSATLCSFSPAPANAAFTMNSTGCIGTPVNVTNNSTGNPTPSFTWTSAPPATFNPNANATAPSITFGSAGAYTITLAANNGTASSVSHVITVSACITPTVCNDTLVNIRNTDTLVTYITGAPTSTCPGWVAGNNCYGDKEEAEWYDVSTYSLVPSAKITDVIVLFYKRGTVGTKGTGKVSMTLYNGTSGGGPTTAISTTSVNLPTITSGATYTNVTYCGNPMLAYASPIILPYKFHLATPANAPASNGFFASLVFPTATGDTVVFFTNTIGSYPPVSTLWTRASDNNWYAFTDGTNNWGISLNGAILPIVTCSTTSVPNITTFENNIMVAPNPSNGTFNVITTFNEKQDIKFEVISTLGQTIAQGEFHNVMNNYLTLDLSKYESGIYFLSITNGTEKVVKRIIINK